MATSHKLILFTLLTLWTATVGAGIYGVWRFDSTPGRPADPAVIWPADSNLARMPGQFTLVMLLHPNCPCSRASLEDLADLMAHSGDRVTAYAVFIQPADTPADPATSDLWKSAVAIPHVTAAREGPAAMHAFNAATSGTVCLYDPSGKLRFHGGITAARGHAGDNDGSSSIESILCGGSAVCVQSPVYGCALR